MPGQWEVVGGADKGGILVREGQDLKSAAVAERLAHGAIVEELALVGERLQYRVISGSGPPTGWVSLKITGKDLLVKREGAVAVGSPADAGEPGGPSDTAGEVEVDEELKRSITADAEAKHKEGALLSYVMKYKILGYPLPETKLRVLCFHNAGSAESNFTGAGTPFINWAKECKKVEICAFDYPGRNKMLKSKRHESTDTLAPELLAVFLDKMMDGVPYVVWGHSVGTWVSFEFLILARKLGLPMPLAGFFMAFPAPHMPEAKRRWHRNRGMSEAEFKEELMNWDREHFTGAGKIVFDNPAWTENFQPMMRADFCLFDEYKFKHNGTPKFSFPIHAWHFDGEHYNTADQIELWKDWTEGPFDFQIMKGMGHLTCVYKPELKKVYYEKVTELIKGYASL